MELTLGKQLKELPGPILITGHTGFKGTWLTFLLEKLNVPVLGLALTPEKDSLFDRTKRTGAIREAFIDVRDAAGVSQFLSENQPSAVIHLAAQPLVIASYKTPRETFETNVMGTANVLDAAFSTPSVKAVVVATTDKVYRNDDLGRAFIENDPLEGKDPYSASKVGTESVVAAWQQIAKVSGGPNVISVRAGNVIGGGDWAKDRLLPDLVRGFRSGGRIHIRNPQSTRPWQHVLDPLHGYLLALEAMFSGLKLNSLNFGPAEESLTVREVAEIAAANWSQKVTLDFSNESLKEQVEAKILKLDSSKSLEILGWKSIWSEADAVKSTILWWHKVINESSSPNQQCLEDIDFMLGRITKL